VTEAHEKTYNIAIQRLKMPPRFAKLRVNDQGFPVPKFVKDVNGKPDFRVINETFLTLAIRHKLCWLCGEALGRYQCFVIGPMCAINRVSSEPPSHKECAEFAARACPFMVNPNRARNTDNLPENKVNPGGVMIERNPGVTLLWITESYRTFKAGNGILIKIGDPVETQWYARGRTATRDEIMESIRTGLPALQHVARQEGPEAMLALDELVEIGLALVPA
jgi:hypothetical protein